MKQLADFIAAGETRSITLAAERVNISQPSVSAAISQLEAEWDLELFVRHHAQGLSLTPSGERLLQAAKAVLQKANELRDVADEVASVVSGALKIGCFRTFAPLIVSEVCKSFSEEYPEVHLHVIESDEAALIEKLRRAEISLAITYSQGFMPDIAFDPLAELFTYVLLAADHPFAVRPEVSLAELADQPFILLDLPISRDYFLSLFNRAGLAPKIAAASDNPETVRSYVASGFGYSLLTARPKNKAALSGRPLSYVPLEGHHPPMVLAVATLNALKRTRAVLAFEEYCRSRISTTYIPGMASLGR